MPANLNHLMGLTQQRLQQLVQRYSQSLRPSQTSAGQTPVSQTLDSSSLQNNLDQLQSLSTHLQRRILRVAVFGLVSRGKSAVINALLGEKRLDTGPLHGVTRWPRSIYWQPRPAEVSASPEIWEEQPLNPWQIEFIDTPGLDEIDGQARSEMAQTVANQADLIMFVVAGAITQQEQAALEQLRCSQKPLLLVFNKIDLYPDLDRQALATQLSTSPESNGADALVDEIVCVAAAPAPMQVRHEWPDGRTTSDWEVPPPQIDALKQVLLDILHQHAPALVALNTLYQARLLETEVINQVSDLHQDQANALIWRFAQYKAIAVSLNPFVIVDLLGGITADLVMIRSLSRLYGFPITNYRASQLWGAILRSSGTLILGELSSFLLGAGKTTAALFSLGGGTSLSALAGAVVTQAGTAGYGTYIVGRAAQIYLAQGCTWGPQGISATMEQVLRETPTSEIIARLKQTIRNSLSSPN